MSGEKKIVIMGAPYGFAKKSLRKPFHAQVVKIVQCPVLCHMGCGLYYIPCEPMTAAQRLDARCPTCEEAPKAWKIGEPDEIEISVKMAFGRVNEVEFIRSLGKVAEHTKLAKRHVGIGGGEGLVTDAVEAQDEPRSLILVPKR